MKLNRPTKWGPVLCPLTDYKEKSQWEECEECIYGGRGMGNEWGQHCQQDAADYPSDPDEVEMRAKKSEG